MRIVLLSIIMVLSFGCLLTASPFVPLEWQTLVETGPLAGQRKHVEWIRDLNGDFIDDAFDLVPADEHVEVIVQLSECRSPEELEQELSVYGGVQTTGVLVAYAVLRDVPKSLLDDLAREPYVAALERPRELVFDTNISTRAVRAVASKDWPQQNLESMAGANNGKGIVVAILDSGIDDKTHDAFKSPGGTSRIVGYYDATAATDTGKNTNPDDVLGHGTAVAGVALGGDVGTWPGTGQGANGRFPSQNPLPLSSYTGEGMAPGASFLDVRVGETDSTTLLVIDALEWVFKNGKADVVNLSVGPKQDNSNGETARDKCIDALVMSGISVVVSMGNDGDKYVHEGAAAEMAIAVGNVDDSFTVAWADDTIYQTSSYGPRTDFDSSNLTIGMLKPDLVAPGTDIYFPEVGTKKESDYSSGTSYAAPHVTGAIALLLGMQGYIPPESIKELLKQTAHRPASVSDYHAATPGYNDKWGYGMLDVYAAAQALENGITDLTFPTTLDPYMKHPNWPDVRRSQLKGNRASYANDADITLATDPPIQADPNTIYVKIENRGTKLAENVVVCVGVMDFAVGAKRFYDVGCKRIVQLSAGASTTVDFPWTPAKSKHQCIQASVAYPFDTDFTNNMTQRNVNPIPVNSPASGTFQVENPLNEVATIVLEVKPDALGAELYEYRLEQDVFVLRPEDCPIMNTIHFYPNGPLPAGETATFDVTARAFSETHADGIELSGVVFKLTPATKPVCWVCDSLYETLVGFDAAGTLVPRLATGWEVSDDATSYTFHLRDGIAFHDGTEFRGDAVLHSLENPVELSPDITRAPLAGRDGVEEIELIDDFAVSIRVAGAEAGAGLLERLAGQDGMIVSPNSPGDHVGTGPFRLSRWDPGVHAVLSAFSGYRDGPPTVPELVFQKVVANPTWISALQTGEFDVAFGGNPDTFVALPRLLPEYTLCGDPDRFQVIAPWIAGLVCRPDGSLRFADVAGSASLRIAVPSL